MKNLFIIAFLCSIFWGFKEKDAFNQPYCLGKKIKKARISKNLTIQECSKLIKISPKTLNAIENNCATPLKSKWRAIETHLGVKIQ